MVEEWTIIWGNPLEVEHNNCPDVYNYKVPFTLAKHGKCWACEKPIPENIVAVGKLQRENLRNSPQR